MMRKSDMWIGAGWLGMSVSISVFMLAPAVHERQELLTDLSRLRAELTAPDASPELFQEIEQSLEALEEFRSGRVTRIPDESDIAGLMQSLSYMLHELELDQKDITTNRPQQLEYASMLPVSLTVAGSFPRIYQAISRIESLPRLIRVDRLRVKAPSMNTATIDRSGVVRAEVSIATFFAPQELADVDGAKEQRR